MMHRWYIFLTGFIFISSLCTVQCRMVNSEESDEEVFNERDDSQASSEKRNYDDMSTEQLWDLLKREKLSMDEEDTDTESFQARASSIDYNRRIISSTCGRPRFAPDLTERIYGGSVAKAHSWPWQVFYQEETSCGNNQKCYSVCGGTLLNTRYVLTAAHCINNANAPQGVTIVAGLHNKQLAAENRRRQFLKVSRIIVHPGWDSNKIINDLAIIQLATPAVFNSYTQAVCLPGPDARPDSTVYLIGWGSEKLGGQVYHVLKQAPVKVIGNCQRYWRGIDNNKQICLAHRTKGYSACKGDSGGSALQKHGSQWVIEGVASYVSDCKTHADLRPNVYVRVSGYLPWIDGIINK